MITISSNIRESENATNPALQHFLDTSPFKLLNRKLKLLRRFPLVFILKNRFSHLTNPYFCQTVTSFKRPSLLHSLDLHNYFHRNNLLQYLYYTLSIMKPALMDPTHRWSFVSSLLVATLPLTHRNR